MNVVDTAAKSFLSLVPAITAMEIHIPEAPTMNKARLPTRSTRKRGTNAPRVNVDTRPALIRRREVPVNPKSLNTIDV